MQVVLQSPPGPAGFPPLTFSQNLFHSLLSPLSALAMLSCFSWNMPGMLDVRVFIRVFLREQNMLSHGVKHLKFYSWSQLTDTIPVVQYCHLRWVTVHGNLHTTSFLLFCLKFLSPLILVERRSLGRNLHWKISLFLLYW